MTTTKSRRIRSAADVAVGYAVDERGSGVAYAAVGTGGTTSVVRLAFAAPRFPALDGLEAGYAAVAVVAEHLKVRGVDRVRIRTADQRVVDDLSGAGVPPKALAMVYVRTRCLLHGLGSFRIEHGESTEVRDLTARARADVQLHVAA
jgi:hypothetical protein